MTSDETNPPRWADALLRSLVSPSDRESISGDLLEEYRAARRPTLGAPGSNIWYITQVLSVLSRLIQPFALALTGPCLLLALTVFRPGHHAASHSPETPPMLLSLLIKGISYGSVVPCPGTSLLDALIYFCAGYHGFQRTGLIKAGLLSAVATSAVGTAVLFAAAAMVTPGLVPAVVVNPLLLLISSVYLLVPMGYAAVLGALSGVVGRWLRPDALIRRLNLSSVPFG